MITSFVQGRMRIRDKKLKNKLIADEIENRITQFKGILGFSINHRVGSLLIFYDKAVLQLQKIIYVLEDYLGGDAAKTRYKKYAASITDRTIVNFAMLASLAVSMFGAAADIVVIHITAGIVFLGFLGLHIFRYKNMLFA